MSIVSDAYTFWEEKIHVLYTLMHDLEDAWFNVFKSKDFSFDIEHGTFLHDHHRDMTLIIGGSKILEIKKFLGMLPTYNSCTPYSCTVPIGTQFGLTMSSTMGYRNVDHPLQSTVTLEKGKEPRMQVRDGKHVAVFNTRSIIPVQYIIERPDELEFQLLLEIDEEFLFYYTLNSICVQKYPDCGINIRMKEVDISVFDIAIEELQQKLQSFRKITHE